VDGIAAGVAPTRHLEVAEADAVSAAVLGHHGLLGVAVAALAAAGLRVASLAAPSGLERALSAVALAVAAAVLEALLLGLVGLGGSALALTLAAVATWLACARLLPTPEPAGRELGAWLRGLGPRGTLLLGAVGGAALAWTAWLLRYPAFGHDSLLYHLPEAVTWVERGSPGEVNPIVGALPVGSYPVTHEVLTSWTLGIAHSFLPPTLLAVGVLVLIGVAAWAGCRALGAPRPAAALAAGALVAAPAAIAAGRTGAALDPVALAWVATCAALCAASPRRPALLAPALVAGGLAIGTKTTALPLTVIVLAAALWAGRAQLRRLALPVGVAGAVACVVGLFWYGRDLVEHGSPFWPFLSLPGGDPLPLAVSSVDFSFLDRPGQTLQRLDQLYLEQFLGGLVLLGGALVAPLVARRRVVWLAAAATVLSVLLWMTAPLTGVSDHAGLDQGTADAVRYLLPALGAAALTLALAAGSGRAGRVLGLGALGAALVLNLMQAFQLGFPGAPEPTTPLAGAAAGILAALVLQRAAIPLKAPRGLAAGGCAVVAALLLAPLAPGVLHRHAQVGLFDHGLTAWFDSRRDDERPVGLTAAVHALTAGERLQRRIELIPAGESCAQLRRRHRRGWIVFTKVIIDRRMKLQIRTCLGAQRPAFEDRSYRIFAPAGSPG
jgi:hypothetical protein